MFNSLYSSPESEVAEDEKKRLLEGELKTSTSEDTGEDIKAYLVLNKKLTGLGDAEKEQARKDRRKIGRQTALLFLRFATGVVITQFFYFLLSFSSNWQPHEAALWTGLCGFVLALGMAFSKTVRSIVVMTLPSFCTGRGRSILLVFCFMMLMSGPSENITYNYTEMARALTCGDELVFNATRGLRQLLRNNQQKQMGKLQSAVDAVVDAVETAENLYDEFLRRVRAVETVIEKIKNFFRKIKSLCETTIGEYVCILPKYVSGKIRAVKDKITAKTKKALKRIKCEFYFKINVTHEFELEQNRSMTAHEITDAILKDVGHEYQGLTTLFDLARNIMWLSIILVLLKSVSYRQAYLTVNHFDNCYVTTRFRKLDKKRRLLDQPSVLPLRTEEEIRKYISPWHLHMSRREVQRFCKGVVFLTINFAYTLSVLFIDHSLYTMQAKMSKMFSMDAQAKVGIAARKIGSTTDVTADSAKTNLNAFSKMNKMKVTGTGFAASIYRSITDALNEVMNDSGYQLDMKKCLPNPKPPEYFAYKFLLWSYFFCYVTCVCEAYILRTRRLIMAWFYPKRERARILFMFNKIIANRGFGAGDLERTQWAMEQMNRTQQHEAQSKLYFYSNQPGILGFLARKITRRTKFRCSVCGLAGALKDHKTFRVCRTPGCSGQYCLTCFKIMHGMCVRCLARTGAKMKRSKQKRKNAPPGPDEPPTTDDERSERTMKRKDMTEDEIADQLFESSGISDSSASEEEYPERHIRFSEQVHVRSIERITYDSITDLELDDDDDEATDRVKSTGSTFNVSSPRSSDAAAADWDDDGRELDTSDSDFSPSTMESDTDDVGNDDEYDMWRRESLT